jgi:RNA-directed DNA polymerase
LEKKKSFTISKNLVMQAYKLVKENKGCAGIDKQTIADFEKNLKDNLYKIWNRMSSGTYYPPPVKAVAIPKKNGGERILGVPTVTDRIAQMVVRLTFEPKVEPYFYADSYGYRPNKSALEAVGKTRERCWRYNWVVEFDIKGMFDNIDHELLMKAVRKHTNNKMELLYIERWLKAPIQKPNGELVTRTKGTPQGSIISPVLSNLFMHYAYDHWMKSKQSQIPWCRYADDGLAHCRTKDEAESLLTKLKNRFEECKLEIHPEKSKIVYCKDGSRKEKYENTKFDFLGYTFCRRKSKNTKRNSIFLNFSPAVSAKAQKAMRSKTRQHNFRNRTDLSLNDIAKIYNPVLRGWLEYYGRYYRSGMYPVLRHFNVTLVSWARRKYRKLTRHKSRAAKFMIKISEREPSLFVHWKKGMVGGFA